MSNVVAQIFALLITIGMLYLGLKMLGFMIELVNELLDNAFGDEGRDAGAQLDGEYRPNATRQQRTDGGRRNQRTATGDTKSTNDYDTDINSLKQYRE